MWTRLPRPVLTLGTGGPLWTVAVRTALPGEPGPGTARALWLATETHAVTDAGPAIALARVRTVLQPL